MEGVITKFRTDPYPSSCELARPLSGRYNEFTLPSGTQIKVRKTPAPIRGDRAVYERAIFAVPGDLSVGADGGPGRPLSDVPVEHRRAHGRSEGENERANLA